MPDPIELITLDHLREIVFEGVRLQYQDETGDYDMTPVAFFGDHEGKLTVVMLADGHPAKLLPRLIEEFRPLIYASATPAWTRDPVTNVRNGECVIVNLETEFESQCWKATVTRNPLTVGEFEQADEFSGRMTHLLHQ